MADRPILTMPDGQVLEFVADHEHVKGDLYLSGAGDLRESIGAGIALCSYFRPIAQPTKGVGERPYAVVLGMYDDLAGQLWDVKCGDTTIRAALRRTPAENLRDDCNEAYAAGKNEAEFGPLGDNHHNAFACPYCNPEGVANPHAAAPSGEQLEGGDELRLAAEELSLAATEFLTEATPPPLDYHERNSPEGVVRVPDTTSTNTPRARFNRAHERLIGAQDNLAASLKPPYGGFQDIPNESKDLDKGSPPAAKDATDDVENPGSSAADGGQS